MGRDLDDPFWHAWGKARPAPEARHSWHPLVYHCLDVAAVGKALLRQRSDKLAGLAVHLGSDPEVIADLLAFLLALHDIGKLSRPFQAKAPDIWCPATLIGPPGGALPRDPGHPVTGAWLLRRALASELAPLFPRWSGDEVGQLLAPFVGHHGKPVPGADIAENRISEREIFGGRCLDAARSFLALMSELFAPQPAPKPGRTALKDLRWSLAGLAVLADWIGSRQSWFPYAAPDRDPLAYLVEVARPRAAVALRQAGIAPARPSTARGYRALTEQTHQPTPTQSWTETVGLPDGPFVAFVEDMTGGGKTEAALILAHRLLADGRARGLYVALPTMATANAMYGVAVDHGRAACENLGLSSGGGSREAKGDRGDEEEQGSHRHWWGRPNVSPSSRGRAVRLCRGRNMDGIAIDCRTTSTRLALAPGGTFVARRLRWVGFTGQDGKHFLLGGRPLLFRLIFLRLGPDHMQAMVVSRGWWKLRGPAPRGIVVTFRRRGQGRWVSGRRSASRQPGAW